MLFHSWYFILFAVAVVGLYYAVPVGRENAWGGKFRRILILVASLYFYAVWRPEYLALILATIGVDYTMARFIERFGRSADGPFEGLPGADAKANIKRRIALAVSLCFDLGLLFAFKYLGFFEETWNAVVAPWMGKPLDLPKLLLPMGISFYTFQSLSYVIDVYRGKIPACRNIAQYALYVTFFPQLVAGPIERAPHLMPQLALEHRFDLGDLQAGMFRILQGFFKKAVLADHLGVFVDAVFNGVAAGQVSDLSPVELILAGIFFTFQIYFDFSGYSDIAIGIARIFGVRLMENFNAPLLATSIYDFWKRWHISLTSWFREYVYFSLGGSHKGRPRAIVNVLVVFFLSGLWHGAAWTFVAWGVCHGVAYVLERPWRKLPVKHPWLGRIKTFALVVLFFTLFRAPDFGTWLNYIAGIFNFGPFESLTQAYIVPHDDAFLKGPFMLCGGNCAHSLFCVDNDAVHIPAALAVLAGLLIWGIRSLVTRGGTRGCVVGDEPGVWRWTWGLVYLLAIIFLGRFSGQGFIYFQF